MASIRSNVVLTVGPFAAIVSVESGRSAPAPTKDVCVGQHGDHAPTPTTAPKTCPECGPITDYSRIRKARKVGDAWAVVSVETLEAIRQDTADQYKMAISLVPHPREQVDAATETGGKVYYLKPTGAHQNYAMIRDLIRANGPLAFTALYTPRTRSSMVVADVRGDGDTGVITLVERTPIGNLNPLPVLEPATPNEAHVKFSQTIVDGLLADYSPDTYVDEYERRVVLAAQASDVLLAVEEKKPTPGRAAVVTGDDLTAQLEQIAKAAAKPKPVRKPRATRARKPAAAKVA